MSTAKQLVSAFVDAPPLYWNRSYVQNMREIRGYPNWWRIRDDVAHIDGPPEEGEQYTKDLYIWSVEIVKDEDTGENTNKIELYNLVNTLEESTSVVNGETVYRWKYRAQEPELAYEHTDVIDSVSLEFDQLGHRLIAFESVGEVFLIWYDPVPGTMVVTNWGAGYTPQIVTDTYRRTGGSADSERLLFYVDNTTKQIVYRRQVDRYQTAYALPQAPSDVVEILKVSKNLYGGLTVLYCYDDGTGNLKTGSFTARDSEDVVNIGTDGRQRSPATLSASTGTVTDFLLAAGLKETDPTSVASIVPASGIISDFQLRDNIYRLEDVVSQATLSGSTGTISDFTLKDVQITLSSEADDAALSATAGALSDFTLEETLIALPSYGGESAELTAVTGQVTDFLLG